MHSREHQEWARPYIHQEVFRGPANLTALLIVRHVSEGTCEGTDLMLMGVGIPPGITPNHLNTRIKGQPVIHQLNTGFPRWFSELRVNLMENMSYMEM